MKKIFGISLVAILAVSPMIAKAEAVAGDPGSQQTELTNEQAAAITAANAPKYALKGAAGTDGNAATAGYVKGAYNALIKGINKTQDEVGALNTGISTYSNAVSHLLDGKATQTGTVATVDAATMTESIATSSVNITTITNPTLSATASGTVNLSVTVMEDWENDTAASSPIQTTASFSGLTVNGLTMDAPGTSNTATLTKNNFSGNVDVSSYLAQAAQSGQGGSQPAASTFDFTQLIDLEGSAVDYKMSDGSFSEEGDWLENDEWLTAFEFVGGYGRVRGTSMCSITGEGMAVGQTGSPSNTSGTYCWCKMIGWRAYDDNSGVTETPVTSRWVLAETGYPCAEEGCASICGYDVRDSSAVRSGMFSVTQ